MSPHRTWSHDIAFTPSDDVHRLIELVHARGGIRCWQIFREFRLSKERLEAVVRVAVAMGEIRDVDASQKRRFLPATAPLAATSAVDALLADAAFARLVRLVIASPCGTDPGALIAALNVGEYHYSVARHTGIEAGMIVRIGAKLFSTSHRSAPPPVRRKVVSISLNQAIVLVLKAANGQGMSIREVAEGVLNAGHKTNAQNFTQHVRNALAERLTDTVERVRRGIYRLPPADRAAG